MARKTTTTMNANDFARRRISGSSASCPAICIMPSPERHPVAQAARSPVKAHARPRLDNLAVDAAEEAQNERAGEGREQRLDGRLAQPAISALRRDLRAHDHDE